MKHFKILIFLAFWSFASQISSLAVVIGVDFAGGDYYTGSEIGGTIFKYNDNIIAEFSYGVYADDSDPNVQKAREVEEILSTIEGVGTLAVGGVSAATRPGFWKSIGSFFKNPFGLFGKGGKEVANVASKGGTGSSSKILINNTTQLQRKFKHATDFGVTGSWNKVAATKYSSAINQHINSPSVIKIIGTYHKQPAIHYVNPKTGLNVISKPSGEFWSGWKLSPEQLKNVIEHGGL